LRLVSATDLQPAFGGNPVSFLAGIAQASDIEILRVLNLRARAFVLEHLATPSAIDWLCALADCVNVALVKRLIELAGGANEGWCWCFWGAAGRQELLTAVEPGVALVCKNSADVSRGHAALKRLRADLVACGYLEYAPPEWEEGMLCAAA